ncbi:SAM-dependent methyltransferase [uncultured Microbacterium sp.]|uniref:SAM-dependent methyltransferase n=1 Tax=uncultured Microbacterium sp. TaxID=191216 RepID=UPI002626CB2E|nr:SAM-dependent methyltransferase [uncultured Microbacterium sp.]
MSWPFLYFSGDGLSLAELTAARLDGDLIDVGEAFMPTDAVETRALRAASLRRLIPTTVALTHASAAWIHGAVSTPPARHTVQRLSRVRMHVRDPRLIYRDHAVSSTDVVEIGGISVTSPARTLADLVREFCGGVHSARPLAESMARWRPDLPAETLGWLEHAPPMHFKRPARTFLRHLAERAAAQEEVTR